MGINGEETERRVIRVMGTKYQGGILGRKGVREGEVRRMLRRNGKERLMGVTEGSGRLGSEVVGDGCDLWSGEVGRLWRCAVEYREMSVKVSGVFGDQWEDGGCGDELGGEDELQK